MQQLWKHLQQWVWEHYEVERHLSEGPPNRKYVWYPMSQCLISKHNLRAVYRFFRAAHLTPFSDIPDKRLAASLRGFLSSSGLTKMTRSLSHEFYKASILRQVKSLLSHWAGQIPPEPLRGKKCTRTSTIDVEHRFHVFNQTVEVRYWLPRRGRDEIAFERNPLEIERLQTFGSELKGDIRGQGPRLTDVRGPLTSQTHSPYVVAGVLVTVLLALLGFSLSRWWTERDAKNKEIAALDAKNERFKNALGLVSDDWKQITSPDALIRSMHWLPNLPNRCAGYQAGRATNAWHPRWPW